MSWRRSFLRLHAPIGPLSSSGPIASLVRRTIQRAGIDAPSHGAHVLRHSAATALLRQGVSLDVIGAVLRHRCVESTAHYAKVDQALLRVVVQPWPAGGPLPARRESACPVARPQGIAYRSGSHVQFLGQRSDIPGLLEDVDVLVVPSHSEGISNATLEAMAKGLPVIATAVDGNLETVLDGVTGTLVATRDPGALAEAIVAYATDSARITREGGKARERAELFFGERAMLDAYEREYSELTGHRT